MEIALLTFHDTTNFGSFLQTYGLFKTLEKMGVDCEVLNYECEAIKRKKYKSMLSEVNKYFKLTCCAR